MSKENFFESKTHGGLNSADSIMAAHTLRRPEDDDWQSRALSGFLDSAKEAWSNKGDTATTVVSGLAIGAAIQTGLNNAEYVGGRVGAAAKIGKALFIGVPLAMSAVRITGADDSAHEAGRMAFETGLFLGAGKLGSMADRVPVLGKPLGPRPVSQVPEKLNYQVFGREVKIDNLSGSYSPVQVRLANGMGFITSGARQETSSLIHMPREVQGVGKFAYDSRSTTLTNSHGSFTRSHVDKSTSVVTRGGDTVSTIDGKAYTVRRTDSGSELSVFPDGTRSVLEGSYQSGRLWSFREDGSIAMKSLPSGKYRLNLDPSGDGIYHFTHGTSRGIAGMVGPRSNYSPLKIDDTKVSLNPPADGTRKAVPFMIPDANPLPVNVVKPLFESRQILDLLVTQPK
ncbi:hypothetical protein KF707_13705 [Candidatus Obscuribacterales bacterium]|nr:hypothetical protein [Candidatus Obscuribacterales bacterium]